jgi:superoxide dismutase, Cu-Zn family
MPGKVHLLAVAALGTVAAGAGAVGTAEAVLGGAGSSAAATIKDAAGRNIGELRIVEGDGKPRITVTVKGLPAGYHGIHVHTKGVCDPRSIDPATGSPFFSAGPHFTLGATAHPAHSGDLPDLLVGADGTGSASFVTDRFRVSQLLDGDGSSVVIHTAPDNQANIPDRYHHAGGTGPDAETLKAGDSGARTACGVIRKGAP